MTSKKRQQKRKTDKGESGYTPKETTQKASKKQKIVENASQSSSAPTRYLERIASQYSDLARSTKSLRISSGSDSSSCSSYGLKDIPSVSSRFIEEDMMAFNATFKPADEYGSVIPDVEGKKYENNLSEPILII